MDNINHEHFSGQHDDEKILYVVRPHWVFLVRNLLKTTTLVVIVGLLYWRGAQYLEGMTTDIRYALLSVIVLFSAVKYWWNFKLFFGLKTYLTDRRALRVCPGFPITQTKRSLFWREVSKVRDVSSSIFWRYLKIGQIEFDSHMMEGSGDMFMPDVFYFEDLANYCDKILHMARTEDPAIKELSPFVAKKKFERTNDGSELEARRLAAEKAGVKGSGGDKLVDLHRQKRTASR